MPPHAPAPQMSAATVMERPRTGRPVTTMLRPQRPETRGGSIEQVVRALVVPRLALSFGAAEAPPRAIPPAMPMPVAALVLALADPSIEAAASLVDAAQQQGIATEMICDALLVPACRELRAHHEAGCCTESFYALGQARLTMLMHRLPWPALGTGARPPRTALTLLTAGCLDDFEYALVERRFERAGWTTRRCGTVVSDEAVALVRGGWWSIAWVGMGRHDPLHRMGAMIRAMRRASLNPALGILCGGARRASPVRIGADALVDQSAGLLPLAEAVVRLRQAEVAGHA